MIQTQAVTAAAKARLSQALFDIEGIGEQVLRALATGKHPWPNLDNWGSLTRAQMAEAAVSALVSLLCTRGLQDEDVEFDGKVATQQAASGLSEEDEQWIAACEARDGMIGRPRRNPEAMQAAATPDVDRVRLRWLQTPSRAELDFPDQGEPIAPEQVEPLIEDLQRLILPRAKAYLEAQRATLRDVLGNEKPRTKGGRR